MRFPFPAVAAAFREHQTVDQPVPDVTEADVERVVRRDFPSDQFDTVMGVLRQYGVEKWHRECVRVHLAVLKLSNRQLNELKVVIDVAKRDYRDVLGPAEYPEYGKVGFRARDLSKRERQQIVDADWKQYEKWFRRP